MTYGGQGSDPDDGPVGRPLPPEDRIWRHPSEMGLYAPSRPAPNAPKATGWSALRLTCLAALGGLVGSTATVGALAFSGALAPRVIERSVVLPTAKTSEIALTYPLAGSSSVPDIARKIQPALARVEMATPLETISGSAIALRSDGYFLTSAELVVRAEGLTVVLANGKRRKAQLVGVDRYTNLGVIKTVDPIENQSIPSFNTDSLLLLGSDTIVVTAADTNSTGPTVAKGVISSTGLRATLPNGVVLHDLVLTDANISLGARGGVLIDVTGSVVAVISTIGKDDTGNERLIYATPITIAKDVGERIIRYGHPADPVLGITGITLPPDQAVLLGITSGVRVDAVVPGSPAQLFGLTAGDVVTTIDGAPIESWSTLVLALRRRSGGDSVLLGFVRSTATDLVTVILGSPKPEPGATSSTTTTVRGPQPG